MLLLRVFSLALSAVLATTSAGAAKPGEELPVRVDLLDGSVLRGLLSGLDADHLVLRLEGRPTTLKTGALRRLALHAVDAVGLVHAVLLRVQVVVMPVKLLVLSGH